MNKTKARRLMLWILLLIANMADLVKQIIYFFVDKDYLNYTPEPTLRSAFRLQYELHYIQYLRVIRDNKYYH